MAKAKKLKAKISTTGIKCSISPEGELLIYGFVGDDWDELDAKSVMSQVQSLGTIDKLDVHINSGGGYVFEGLAIYNFLVGLEAQVNVYIDGIAASMASAIAMAGDNVFMPENAIMMIHNPWDVSIGDAESLRKDADTLDKVKNSLITIYRDRTGMDESEISALMDDETYLTAQEALDYGFIDAIIAPVPDDNLTQPDMAAYHVPERLKAVAGLRPDNASTSGKKRAFVGTSTTEDDDMTKSVKKPDEGNTASATGEQPTAVTNEADIRDAAEKAAKAATRAERTRQTEIRKAVRAAKLPESYADDLIENEIPLDAAREKIINKWADEEQTDIQQGDVRGGADSRDKQREAFVNATLSRVAMADEDRGNPYRGFRLSEIARACLENSGVSTSGQLPEEYIRSAMQFMPRGAQTTSDFPVILENVLHRMVLRGFTAQAVTWSNICKTGDVTDFRDWKRLVPGMLGNMDTVSEAGEYKNKIFPDAEAEPISVTRRGNILEVTPEIIINDDLGLISEMANELGMVGSRSIDRAVYTLLEANPVLTKDSTTLFHADHGNLAASGAAPTIALIDSAAVAMSKQKAPGEDAELLDIEPDVALVPRELRGTMIELINAEYNDDSQRRQNKPNRVRGIVSNITSTGRLASATAWYLFANPSINPVIEVVFLNGQREPRVTQEENFRTSGIAWKVELPFGVGAIDYRGVYKNPGV